MSIALLPRIERFLGKPWNEKREVLAWHTRQALRRAKYAALFVRRIQPGFWWIAWEDEIRDSVLAGTFEISERKFVQRFLQPGMTVLDIGAYYGLYSLLAATVVGGAGQVIAFEPGPYQRKRLLFHVWLNGLRNLRVESVGLGNIEGEETFFSVPGAAAGYSGLRPPESADPVVSIRVQVLTLDAYLREHSVTTVDFIKIDVEGGELDVFKGAENLLRKENRPVILCELQDIRTKAWGHKANDTAAFLESFGYRWFRPLPGGNLAPVTCGAEAIERNLIAVPPERMHQAQEMIK